MIRERVDPQARVRYLTLNVFSQAIADHLAELPNEPSEEAKALLEEAIEALRNIGGGATARFKTRRGLRPFHDYEQLTTLCEVLGGKSRTDALARIQQLSSDLQRILDNLTAPDASLINPVREDFRRVATEALRRSRRPAEGIPRRVVELCH